MMQGKVCVSVIATDVDEVIRTVLPVAEIVDVVVIRLDGMLHPQVEKCCRLIDLPLLFTNRPTWEGGAFIGNEEERLAPLIAAVHQQAAYVDFEFRAEISLREQLLAQTRQSSTRLILSWHNFDRTPSEDELTDILVQMQASGADIGKIITTAHDESDVLRVLSLQEKARALQFPLSGFCMGESGRISRFATLYLGGCMSYVAASEGQATAPGQFSATHFQKLRSLFSHVD